MSTRPQIDPANAIGETAALLEQLRMNMGAVPNMAKAMANSPALLKGWMELRGALAGGVLPAQVRERLALATAEYNPMQLLPVGAHHVGQIRRQARRR